MKQILFICLSNESHSTPVPLCALYHMGAGESVTVTKYPDPDVTFFPPHSEKKFSALEK